MVLLTQTQSISLILQNSIFMIRVHQIQVTKYQNMMGMAENTSFKLIPLFLMTQVLVELLSRAEQKERWSSKD